MKSKTAVVCGSTQGIGKEVAIGFAKSGLNLILIARSEEKLVSTKKELLQINPSILIETITADFSDYQTLAKILKEFTVNCRSVDILVNNTGGPKGGSILEASIDEFISCFNQHLVCNQILAQAFVPGMIENKWGRIINIISTSVKQPLPGLGVSNTVRGAVGNWSKTLANELGQYNITVNNVLPGATNTIRLQGIAEAKADKTGESISDIFHEMALESPMKRIAEPSEIANAVLFLASEQANYINGINIPVDGGRTKVL
jgi:3-oxoacyl-[acyl-carrier protein] reductase